MFARAVLALAACAACGRMNFEQRGAGDGPSHDSACTGDACSPVGTRRIVRSVGVGTGAPLAIGTGALTIESTTATFGTALPDNVGVGDAIEYDANGDGTRDAIAFIHGRSSSTVFTVRDATAALPAPTTSTSTWAVYRAYLSLANAVDRTAGGTRNPNITVAFDGYTGGRDLVAADEQLDLACYDDGMPDPVPVEICSTSYTRKCATGAWTTDATHFLRIFTPTLPSEVGVTQRHVGTWANGYRRTDGIILYEGFVRLDGLAIRRGNVGVDRTYYVETEGHGGEVWISNSFGWNAFAGASKVYDIWDTGVAALGSTYTVYKLWNDIAYNESTTDTRSGFYINSNRAQAFVYASTAYVKGGGAFYQASGSQTTVKNCLGFAELNPAFGGTDNFVAVTGSVSNDGTLNGIPNGTANAWNQAIAYRSLPLVDLHLADPPAAALRSGENLSADPVLSFNDDIDGTPRPTGAWDIGADQAP